MNLGIGTVKVHLAGVYKGLGARNRMEAIVKAGRAANG
jgi:DNA-binding NarL/FixJ family response regulator